MLFAEPEVDVLDAPEIDLEGERVGEPDCPCEFLQEFKLVRPSGKAGGQVHQARLQGEGKTGAVERDVEALCVAQERVDALACRSARKRMSAACVS